MAKKKVTRKKLLKEPDEFITFSARMLQWIAQNKDRMLWGAIAVAFIGLAVFGWMYYQKTRERKATAAYGEIMAAYRQADSNPASPESRSKVKESLGIFIKKYPNTGSGKMGQVMYASLCFQTGDPDSAIAAYQQALEDYQDQPLLKNVILSSIGHAYLKKQDPDRAVKYFEQIASGDAPVLKDEALFILAKLSEKRGDAAAVSEKLNRILSDFPDSLYAPLVQEEAGETAAK